MGKTYEIWTLDVAEEFCQKVYEYARDTQDCYTLGEAAVECGEYEAVLWYLQGKFKVEFDSILKAKEIIRNRCIKLGMNGKTQPTMTIFNLVNNFDMVNTNTKSDLTTKGKEIKPYMVVPEGIANELLKDVNDKMDESSEEDSELTQ